MELVAVGQHLVWSDLVVPSEDHRSPQISIGDVEACEERADGLVLLQRNLQELPGCAVGVIVPQESPELYLNVCQLMSSTRKQAVFMGSALLTPRPLTLTQID